MEWIENHPVLSALAALAVLNQLFKGLTGIRDSPLRILFAGLIACTGGGGYRLGEPVAPKVSPNHFHSLDRKNILFSGGGNTFELGVHPLNADPESFELIDAFWSKDRECVYYEETKIDYLPIDTESFQVTDFFYAKDKRFMYYLHDKHAEKPMKIIEGADPQSYQVFDYVWGKDKRHYFFHGKKIEVDYDSFEKLNDNFCKDKNHAYLYFSAMRGFDEEASFFRPIQTRGEVSRVNDRYIRDAEAKYCFHSNLYFEGESDQELRRTPFGDEE